MLKLQFLKHTGDSVMFFFSTKMFKNSLSVQILLSVQDLQVKERIFSRSVYPESPESNLLIDVT